MDFNFVNDLVNQLTSTNIFTYTFVGGKVLACAFMLFKLINIFLKSHDNSEIKLGEIFSLFGYALLIMSSDWIIGSIENVFAGVDVTLGNTSSDVYKDLADQVNENIGLMFSECEDTLDFIIVFSRFFVQLFVMGLILIMGSLFKLADMSITASFLVQRVFIIQLLKFLFPLVIAFSTLDQTQNLLFSWVKRYIGMFVLAIAYIGIINFMKLVQSSLYKQFPLEMTLDSITSFSEIGAMITIIVCFVIKIRLLKGVTSYVMTYFS